MSAQHQPTAASASAASVATTGTAAAAAALDREIERLPDLDLAALRSLWRQRLRSAPPPQLTRPLLLRLLAYRLQAKLHGDLDRDSLRLLERIERERQRRRAGETRQRHKKAAPPIPPPPRPDLGAGTLLVREFAGQMHTVTVMADGFAWQGATYTSLSEVARAITGTRWNGPRFFGLRDKTAVAETGMAR